MSEGLLNPFKGLLTRGLLAAGLCAGLFLSAVAAEVALTDGQKARLAELAPGVKMTPELFQLMTEIVYNADLNVEDRLKAISRLAGLDKLPPGEQLTRKICVWDIGGRAGPIYAAAMDQRARALEFGINLEMEPYTNEAVMADALKSGICDAALMSGMRARLFNTFSGTIDSIGGVPDQQHMRTLMHVVASPKMAGKMASGEYVILGVFPAGGAYVFVNDRSISSLARASGKRIAVLEFDPLQSRMISNIGATPVATDMARAPGMFNNGVVDILGAPLVAYEILELYKGMTPNGGIIDYPLAQISMQLVGRRDKFPNEIAQLIREATLERYDEVAAFIAKEEAKVPQKWWIPIPDDERMEYDVMTQSARIALRNQGYYDADMLALQRKIRCKFDPTRGECVAVKE